jgi:hypothetical protein
MFAGSAALLALLLGATPAQAQYLDPGAGSVVVQLVIAAVVGAGAVLKLYWRRISTLLGRQAKRSGR